MSPYYYRAKAGAREEMGAGLAAACVAMGVGLVTYYFVRLYLQRRTLDPRPPEKPRLEGRTPSSGKREIPAEANSDA